MTVTAVLGLWCSGSLLMAILLGRAIRASQHSGTGLPEA